MRMSLDITRFASRYRRGSIDGYVDGLKTK